MPATTSNDGNGSNQRIGDSTRDGQTDGRSGSDDSITALMEGIQTALAAIIDAILKLLR